MFCGQSISNCASYCAKPKKKLQRIMLHCAEFQSYMNTTPWPETKIEHFDCKTSNESFWLAATCTCTWWCPALVQCRSWAGRPTNLTGSASCKIQREKMEKKKDNMQPFHLKKCPKNRDFSILVTRTRQPKMSSYCLLESFIKEHILTVKPHVGHSFCIISNINAKFFPTRNLGFMQARVR